MVLAVERPVAFNRDIRPVLSDKCFACHGPDAKKVEADLRLDLVESATGPGGAIIPGDAAGSPLMHRITSQDVDEVMPPPETHKPLEPEEIKLFARWIDQGAEYQPHWTYTPLVRPALPPPGQLDWGTNAIDRFVAAKLAAEGAEPSPAADPVTLIRRLSFDLTGLAPTLSDVERFAQDPSDEAYAALVDRLLDSPRFGERMAIYWLDLVRYADTVGYHGDQDVSQSPYRDYVIDAFNGNMPYDRFVREQLAGDLLPNPTTDQLIASGYNRLNQTTEEGGSQAKEYLAIYFADRVRNVSQVFMGATVGCAQCHDHKYDPYTARDFYSLGAFFADVEERGVYGARSRPPEMPVPTADQTRRLAEIESELAACQAHLDELRAELTPQQSTWESETQQAVDSLPDDIRVVLQMEPAKRSEEHNTLLSHYYLSTIPRWAEKKKLLDELEKAQQSLSNEIRTTVITKSVEPRVVRILPRGNWMDDSGEIVQPAIPAFLGKLETGERRATRLDLAAWLCRDDNVLTARTMVNRLWFLMFGRGICTSVDDLGGQGTFPTHPELLDYLAVEFVESGWDIKHIMRMIASSACYRQSSKPTPELRAADPYNQLFARQARFRVDGEMIRDSALQISGLLVEYVGGKSTKPYQPAGYYAQLNFPKREYEADQQDSQYRRGVYTHWQRTFLHPMLKAFDAPSREECTARRSRSNTPLQALTLLNDPTFVEAARVFAERILREGGATQTQRVDWAYRMAVSRTPEPLVAAELNSIYDKHYQFYATQPDHARQLVATGLAPVAKDLDVAELAAWTSVARVILNLHETITRY